MLVHRVWGAQRFLFYAIFQAGSGEVYDGRFFTLPDSFRHDEGRAVSGALEALWGAMLQGRDGWQECL